MSTSIPETDDFLLSLSRSGGSISSTGLPATCVLTTTAIQPYKYVVQYEQ